MGRVEGSLEEVPHAALAAGWEGRPRRSQGFPLSSEVGGHRLGGVPPAAPHASLLASLLLCEPWGSLAGSSGPWLGWWGVDGALWVLACLSNATCCWCLSLPAVGEVGQEAPSPREAVAELLCDGGRRHCLQDRPSWGPLGDQAEL